MLTGHLLQTLHLKISINWLALMLTTITTPQCPTHMDHVISEPGSNPQSESGGVEGSEERVLQRGVLGGLLQVTMHVARGGELALDAAR